MNRIKTLLFVVTILIITAAVASYALLDNNFLIRKWNFPLDEKGFWDARQMAMAAESYAQGYDPLFENPANPIHKLNYPRIWHLLFAFGFNQSHTNLIGSITAIIFFLGIGVFWFSRKFDNFTSFILAIMTLSPAVMLGVERANIELVVFCILSIALTINYYSSIAALYFFIFASILKLYPVFGFVYLLKENKRRFWLLFLSASGIIILYVVLTFNDILQVIHTTPQALVGSSFGIHNWWMGLRHPRFVNLPISAGLALFLKIFSYVAAFLILTVSLFTSMRRKDNRLFSEAPYIDSFRVGASIYICCFLLKNTHDYGLIFLLFTIPQIVAWIRDNEYDIASISKITLAAMLFSLWSFFVMRFLGRRVTFLMEEFSNWIMLAGLLYLFFSSLPDWFRDYLRRPFSGITRIYINNISSND